MLLASAVLLFVCAAAAVRAAPATIYGPGYPVTINNTLTDAQCQAALDASPNTYRTGTIATASSCTGEDGRGFLGICREAGLATDGECYQKPHLIVGVCCVQPPSVETGADSCVQRCITRVNLFWCHLYRHMSQIVDRQRAQIW